jgi:hypothetical protein
MDISSISSNEIVNLISDVTEHEAISEDVPSATNYFILKRLCHQEYLLL